MRLRPWNRRTFVAERYDQPVAELFDLQDTIVAPVQPEAVEPRLLDSDDREAISSACLGLALEFGKAQQQRRHIAGRHGVLRHLLAGARRQRRDELDFAAQFQRDEYRGNTVVDGGRNSEQPGVFGIFPS
jgi:hypothetical protein